MEKMASQMKVVRVLTGSVFASTILTMFTPNPDHAKFIIIFYYFGLSIAGVIIPFSIALPVANLFKEIL